MVSTGMPCSSTGCTMLMVLFQVVTQDDVYVVEGRVGNLPVNRDDGVVILL